jgi:hypothetical protein
MLSTTSETGEAGVSRAVARWGLAALVLTIVALVALNLTTPGSTRSLLVGAIFIGAAVGPVVSRCIGNPGLAPQEPPRVVPPPAREPDRTAA